MRSLRIRLPGRLAGDEGGSSLVEFAISATLLLVTMFSILDFARALYAYHFVSYAAEEGARFAMVRGVDWSSSCSTSAPPNYTQSYDCDASAGDVQNYVQSLATVGITGGSVTASALWPGTTPDCTTTPCTDCSSAANSQGCYVQVQVTYPFTFVTPFLSRASITMTATSEKVIQY